MRFDQAPLGGASNDLPTDDLGFELEQIAEQADRIADTMFPDLHAGELATLIASLARALSRKGVA